MATPPGASLLPKLRDQIAEFLNEGYPVHLGIFYLPTCVGLRYGRHMFWLEAFLGSLDSITSPGSPPAYHNLSVNAETDLPISAPYRLGGFTARNLSFRVPPSLITNSGGTGISTCCPSATPRGLALGPTNPRRTSLASEPLGFRCG
jgi:hypothetical protein